MARTIHIHATEVSTDGDAIGDYARGIVVALALATIAFAAWLAMMPAETAELPRSSDTVISVASREPLLTLPVWAATSAP